MSGNPLLVDGEISLEYDGGGDETFNLNGDASFQETVDLGKDTLQQITGLDGSFHAEPSSGALDGNYTDINATLTADGDVLDASGDVQEVLMTLIYDGFGLVSESQGSEGDSLALDGAMTFRDFLEGRVSVVTDTLLVQESSEECPHSGNLSIAGAEGS